MILLLLFELIIVAQRKQQIGGKNGSVFGVDSLASLAISILLLSHDIVWSLQEVPEKRNRLVKVFVQSIR